MAPEANIGVATGSNSNIFVVDVDGDEGRDTLATLLEGHKVFDEAGKVLTGRGEHYYFRCDGLHVGNRKLGPGIDLRGDGGYVVGPGSCHASGAMYRPAKWGCIGVHRRLQRPPPWLVEMIGSSCVPIASGASHKDSRVEAYGQAALGGELDRLRDAKLGARNNTLNTSAFRLGQLIAEGSLDQDLAASHLKQVARQIGLEEAEIAATVASGIAAGRQSPRQPIAVKAIDLAGMAAAPKGSEPSAAELAPLDETDVGNAQRLARRFGNILAHTPGRGYLVFDGRRWQADDRLRRMGLAEATASLIAREAQHLEREADRASRARFAKASSSKGSLERMLDVARHRLMRDDDAFDAHPYLLNVANGTVDLRVGEIRPHAADDLLTKIVAVTFDPTAECPIFERFLNRALKGDTELIAFVQKGVGLTLTGSTVEQIFFFLHGPGSTGKSTFLNLVRDLLGDYGVHTPTESLLAKQYDTGIPADIARLKGARMVTATEVNWNRQIDEAKLKAMTGGDPLTARFLHQNFFQFMPHFKLWIAANDLPGVRGTAEAFWRRVRVVPFVVPVEKDDVDADLPARLKAELPGILAWAVRGCLLWQQEGLRVPEAVQQATAGWVRKADHLVKFVSDELVEQAGNDLGAHDCHERYKAWCAKHGETPFDTRRFKAGLEGADYTHKQTRSGSVWVGLKLRLTG